MSTMNHRFVDTNGIKMHLVEQGQGPLVILCHGFPEGCERLLILSFTLSYTYHHSLQFDKPYQTK